jgi:hypothetical protein
MVFGVAFWHDHDLLTSLILKTERDAQVRHDIAAKLTAQWAAAQLAAKITGANQWRKAFFAEPLAR